MYSVCSPKKIETLFPCLGSIEGAKKHRPGRNQPSGNCNPSTWEVNFWGVLRFPKNVRLFFEVESIIELFKWIIAPGKDRWRNATTISLGLSWLLTICHQIWEWRCAIYFHHSVSFFVCTIYLPPISAKYNLGDHLQMNLEPLGNPRLVSIHICIHIDI